MYVQYGFLRIHSTSYSHVWLQGIFHVLAWNKVDQRSSIWLVWGPTTLILRKGSYPPVTWITLNISAAHVSIIIVSWGHETCSFPATINWKQSNSFPQPAQHVRWFLKVLTLKWINSVDVILSENVSSSPKQYRANLRGGGFKGSIHFHDKCCDKTSDQVAFILTDVVDGTGAKLSVELLGSQAPQVMYGERPEV